MRVGCISGAAATFLAFSASSAMAVSSLNLHDVLAPVKTKLADGQQANIVMLGDSLSFRPGSYLPYFRDNMQAFYGNAGAGWQGSSLWTGGGFDGGWVNGRIDHDDVPYHSVDGLWASTSKQTTGFISPQSRDIQLQYIAQPGGGSFQLLYSDWYRGQGEVRTLPVINTASTTTEIRTLNWHVPDELALGTNQLWFQTQGNGTITILGENNVNSSPGVRIHRAANGGWGVHNFLTRDWTFDKQLSLLNTDLVMVWLGQNDQPYDYDGYRAKLEQLVSRINGAVPDAKVVLVGTYNQGSPTIRQLVDAMQSVAADKGLGFINIYDAAGDTKYFTDHGYMDDGVHFSPAGGAYLGDVMYNAFRSDGAYFMPGDASSDVAVNQNDLKVLAAHWHESGADVDFTMGDFNFDHAVDELDLDIVRNHWQLTGMTFADAMATTEFSNGQETVPEPASALALCIVGAAGAMQRRHRLLRR